MFLNFNEKSLFFCHLDSYVMQQVRPAPTCDLGLADVKLHYMPLKPCHGSSTPPLTAQSHHRDASRCQNP